MATLLNKLQHSLNQRPQGVSLIHLRIFYAFGLSLAFCLAGALASETWLLLALPFVGLAVLWTILDYRWLYPAMLLSLPISTELELGSLGLDFPAELLVIALLGLVVLLLLSQPWRFAWGFLWHWLSYLILAHWLWTFVTVLTAEEPILALKFWLAKTWYLGGFYLATAVFIKDTGAWRRMIWFLIIPLSLATLKVLAHHAWLNFSFTGINEAGRPFFRNHVSYAAILALSLPLIWFLRGFYLKKALARWILNICLLICFTGMAFSYTRAAYVALFLGILGYWAIRWRLLFWAFFAAFVLVATATVYLISDNRFLRYAPTERTIAHKEFDDLVAATYSFEDVSTMERYHRWIGGIYMGLERPLLGFGPNCFYPYYKEYTLNRFTTYISANEERSGIHNYFLMLWVEQGLPAVLFFLLISLGTLLLAQGLYHRFEHREDKIVVMASAVSLLVINAFLLMNDLIETEKVGSFFFIHTAILVIWSAKLKPQNKLA